ncbi:helix-turn-helix domain-containing protein [Amycolatopsis nigrescens]|uniref:helix-turn-helix domain-containing protein n=1 Tax=Amycolatopsis nigrescens TaxID=381445 RepID=UPI00035F1932|nr:helix-turn-helix domain-containing protein [Amycolatopsis nigrescens]
MSTDALSPAEEPSVAGLRPDLGPPLAEPNGAEFVWLMAELVRLRNRRGLSQKEVAGRMGVDPATICRLEQGVRSEVRVSQLQRYAGTMGLRVAMVITVAD